MTSGHSTTLGLTYPWFLSKGWLFVLHFSWPLARVTLTPDRISLGLHPPLRWLFPIWELDQSEVAFIRRTRGGIQIGLRGCEEDPFHLWTRRVDDLIRALSHFGWAIESGVAETRLFSSMPGWARVTAALWVGAVGVVGFVSATTPSFLVESLVLMAPLFLATAGAYLGQVVRLGGRRIAPPVPPRSQGIIPKE